MFLLTQNNSDNVVCCRIGLSMMLNMHKFLLVNVICISLAALLGQCAPMNPHNWGDVVRVYLCAKCILRVVNWGIWPYKRLDLELALIKCKMDAFRFSHFTHAMEIVKAKVA